MTIITPSGHHVRVHPLHAALLHPDDVAQQAHFMTLGAAGHDEAVQREVRAAVAKARLHMANVGVLLRERMT